MSYFGIGFNQVLEKRVNPAEIKRQAKDLAELPLVQELMNTVSDYVVILNSHLQVVFINRRLSQFLNLPEKELIGKRLGEVIGCKYAQRSEKGCGTTKFCRVCGAYRAIVETLQGNEPESEYSVSLNNGDALVFKVRGRSFQWKNADYNLITLSDVSDKKRRIALERIFFHDLLNTAGSIYTAAGLVNDVEDERKEELMEIIHRQASSLIDEIKAQRVLTLAETGDLDTEKKEFKTSEVTAELLEKFKISKVGKDKDIELKTCEDGAIKADKSLLKRVLSNMLKNALEAAEKGEKVQLGCKTKNGSVEFWVHNNQVIPGEDQLKVFKRSFSTKGRGRGLGTYSMKLLTEKYLDGKIEFTSKPGQGTTFRAVYPAN